MHSIVEAHRWPRHWIWKRDLTQQLRQTSRKSERKRGKSSGGRQEGRSIKWNLRWQLYISKHTVFILNNFTLFSVSLYPFSAPSNPSLSLQLWLYELWDTNWMCVHLCSALCYVCVFAWEWAKGQQRADGCSATVAAAAPVRLTMWRYSRTIHRGYRKGTRWHTNTLRHANKI